MNKSEYRIQNTEYRLIHKLSLSVKRSVSATVCILSAIAVLTSCNPEAKWSISNVHISMTVKNVSAGFAECDFETNKDAYYFIDIIPAIYAGDPMGHQKQFMTLALDSAYSQYLLWREALLEAGEFTIAPFASHSLQYGNVQYFFTGLAPDTEYWIYAFVVNPEKMEPVGKLYAQKIQTKAESIMDIHFAYRIKGKWDYIYPLDKDGNIYTHFPYIALTMDSLEIEAEGYDSPLFYFSDWVLYYFIHPNQAEVLYGVKAVENDGWQSAEEFTQGHTYYTAITGFDGLYEHSTIYKFTWTGDSCAYFFHDTDPENIVNSISDEDLVDLDL